MSILQELGIDTGDLAKTREAVHKAVEPKMEGFKQAAEKRKQKQKQKQQELDNMTGFNADVSSCVQASMRQWKFTAPNKPSRFELILDLVIG